MGRFNGAGMSNKIKILIVDDERINLEFFEIMLTNLGFDVVKAMDGEEALERVVDENPGLIILDTVMPKLSGWKVTKLLKTSDEYASYRDIPIIMFSAVDDVKDRVEGYELGVEDYIAKPFNFSEVLARIRAVLRHRMLSLRIADQSDKLDLAKTLSLSYSTFVEELKKHLQGLDPVSPEPTSFDDVMAFLNSKSEVLEGERRSLFDSESGNEQASLTLRELVDNFQMHLGLLKDNEGLVHKE